MNFVDKFFSKYPEEKIVKWFIQNCKAEAISWLFLFIAMIWIRMDEDGLLPTIFIIIVGNFHGLFFTLYLIFCLPCKKIFDWDDEDFVFALCAAFFPFATLWSEKKLARKDREE